MTAKGRVNISNSEVKAMNAFYGNSVEEFIATDTLFKSPDGNGMFTESGGEYNLTRCRVEGTLGFNGKEVGKLVAKKTSFIGNGSGILASNGGEYNLEGCYVEVTSASDDAGCQMG